MLHMLAKDVYVAMKREAEDRDGDGVKESHVKNLLLSRILERGDQIACIRVSFCVFSPGSCGFPLSVPVHVLCQVGP